MIKLTLFVILLYLITFLAVMVAGTQWAVPFALVVAGGGLWLMRHTEI